MRSGTAAPTHEAIAADLVRVRSSGLIRLRHATVPTLRQSAVLAGLATDEEDAPSAIEAILRRGVARLGGGRLEEAASYTYGLVQGTRDWPAADRRRKGAEIYRVSVDRFRKHYEKIVHQQLAEAIIGLVREAGSAGLAGGPGPADGTGLAGSIGSPSGPGPTGTPVGAGAGVLVTPPDPMASGLALTYTENGVTIPIVVHHTSVDMVADVDVVVCPLNTYLELASTYKNSVAACLRWAGARRRPTGDIVVDCVSQELDRWRVRNAKPGLPVAPGTVAATAVDPGGDLGFRRIYYAAVATPRAGTNDYHVEPASIARAVHNVFHTARAERDTFTPPLASLCLPLLGAGRGGLPASTSFSWIWAAIRAECLANPGWRVHFVAIQRSDAETIRQLLVGLGATESGR